ncbi:TPA: fimbrial protein [Escherichia coli]|nr:fimbrial protein [Escherichia coli]
MKIKVIALATFVSAVFAGSAMAYDGTITFTGKVVAQTCAVNTEDTNLEVTLPTVATSSLKDEGATSGMTPFAIRLTGCSTNIVGSENVKAYFEPSSNIDLATHNLKNTALSNKADNVQIQLLNSNGTSPILLGEADNGQDVQSEVIGTDGSATLRYMAQYYATGKSTAGDVKATVHYTIAYE